MPPCEGGYKEFKIGELFKVYSPLKRFNANNIKLDGGYRYVARGSSNNGIKGYTTQNTKYLCKAKTISFGQDTATIYYQSEPYFTGDKIKVMEFKCRSLDERLATFLIATMRKAFSLFAWGQTSFNESVLNNVKIHLPTTFKGEIDFQYIEERMRELEEERMRELEEERMRELEAYLAAAGFANCDLTPEEQVALRKFSNGEVKFTSCRIDSLFKIATGRDIIIGKTKHGDIPLISHQHSNNGISQYVQAIPDRRIFCYKDTLPLADRGVFLATTQNKDFHIGTRVKALTFKTGEQSENTRLFLVSAINKLQIFFTEYLTNATDSLPNLEIKLPIVPSGEIDYDFMGTYISAIKKQIIARLKAEIAREHKAYESVING